MSKARRRTNREISSGVATPKSVGDIALQQVQVIALRQPFRSHEEQVREMWRDWRRSFAPEIDTGELPREVVENRIYHDLWVALDHELLSLIRHRLNDHQWSPSIHGWEPVASLLLVKYGLRPLQLRSLYLVEAARMLEGEPPDRSLRLIYEEEQIVQTLRRHGKPLCQEELLHKAGFGSNGTFKKVLAMMVERGVLGNCRRRGGYFLPEWGQG